MGESERRGDSPLDQRRSSSSAVCRFCTLHRRNRRISQVPRQLLAECAKTAQAHFLFRQMIAKSLRGRRVHNRIASWSVGVHVDRGTAPPLLNSRLDECGVAGSFRRRGSSMSYQAPHQVTSRATLSSATVEELLADPSRTRGLVLESVPELLTQVASRVASLKTLEGALLALMASQRVANGGARNAGSALLGAAELAKLLGVPESWVREQARLGNLPSFKLGHYVRFRIEEVERFLAQRASQAA